MQSKVSFSEVSQAPATAEWEGTCAPFPPDLVEDAAHREERQHDRPLSFHWRTVDFDRIQALGLDRHASKQLNAARNSILTEAMLAHDERRWVSYSRRKAFYVGAQRYHGTAYTHASILSAINEALQLELIAEERALPGDRGWQSRFRATPRLVEGLAGALIEYQLCGLIRLKDAAGTLIDFRESASTVRMRREIEAINEFLASVDLWLNAPDAVRTEHHLLLAGAHYRPTPAPMLYRVFNRGSFLLGGRAYGWWQSLPKAYRRQLLINGEPTCEPDFSQMHASILYALRGHRLDHDVYETGEFSRDEGKLAFNVALNAKTLPGAISALTNKSDWKRDHQETARLIEVLKRRNPEIAEDLHADRGAELMRIDSDITLGAMMECTKAGIPALPIHDSMRTPARHASHVAEIMEASAARRLKAVSPCRVKVPGHTVPQMPSGTSSPPVFSLVPSVSAGAISASSGLVPVQLDLFPSAPSFSLPILRLRKQLGLSQRAFGERIGCKQPHIDNVEKGRSSLGSWSSRRARELLKEVA